MTNIKVKFLVFLSLILSMPYLCQAQNKADYEISYEINRNYPPLSITKEKLKDAKTLADLNPYYKPSWVKEYLSVEISATNKGNILTADSKSNNLSEEQMTIMSKVDSNTNISVRINYIPENTLIENDPKEINFTFIVEPENEAQFLGGQVELDQYLTKMIGDRVKNSIVKQHQLAVVKFTVDEFGNIVDPEMLSSTDDETTDKLLLDTVCDMPKWKPAEYADGTKIKQEFAFTFGDHNSCNINLVNLRHANKLISSNDSLDH